MKTRTLTCALGAIVLAAGVASSQTQTPAGGGNRTGTQGNPGTESNTGTERNTGSPRRQSGTNARNSAQTRTYTGCLSGNATSGYTLKTMGGGAGAGNNRSGNTAASNATNTGNMSYTVVAGTSGTDLSTLVNQRVEIVGTVSDRQVSGTSGMGNSGSSNTRRGGNSSPGGAGNTGAGNTADTGNTQGRGGYATEGAGAGNTPAGGAGNSTAAGGAGMSSGMGAHSSLTVTSIRAVPGSCTP